MHLILPALKTISVYFTTYMSPRWWNILQDDGFVFNKLTILIKYLYLMFQLVGL